MRFRSYDSLRLFVVVARYQSFTAAGQALNLTKGAVSYQIKLLERELSFKLFSRLHNRVVLTEKGRQLLATAQSAFQEIEQEITYLRGREPHTITIGASTYFSSRWLAPRLMTFMARFPDIRLRLQPIIGLGDLAADRLDFMVRWGKGDWSDVPTEPLLTCPALVTAGSIIAYKVERDGLESSLSQLRLLHDREGSVAWRDWYSAAGLNYRPRQDSLVIPDPNVRVEAVISGQGIALNDALVKPELENGRLFQISETVLTNYGYFLSYLPRTLEHPAQQAFRDWIIEESAMG